MTGRTAQSTRHRPKSTRHPAKSTRKWSAGVMRRSDALDLESGVECFDGVCPILFHAVGMAELVVRTRVAGVELPYSRHR